MASKKTDEKATLQLIINGQQAKSSLKDVSVTMIGLERQLRTMKREDDPAGFDALVKQLKLFREVHGQMLNEIRGGEGSLLKFKLTWKDLAAGFVGGNITMMAIEKIVGAIPALVNKAGELSDSLADVSKQTGITGNDLLELNADLAAIDTRTPIEQLRGLAAVAGKLGYTTRDDVLAFVKAADMINVALGEDLGGNVEEVVNDIGKLVKIFGLEEAYGIEKAMLMVASGINTIGASSAANEGYLVQWAKRFAGIAPNAGISIADTLGMAATMDILGQSSEMSATNIGKMILALGKDIPYFAKVAKMSVKDFSNLLKTDGNEAFIKVLEGAKSTTKGVQGLANMLETLGIEGSEGAAVIGALVKNTDELRKQQDIANKSVSEGISIQQEFAVKNQNSAAILEKIGKVIAGWFEKAAAGFNPIITGFGTLFGVISKVEVQLGELKKQQEKVIEVEAKFPALLKRYDELKTKTTLTGEEQKELKKIVNELSKEVPNAVTSFDKYGNALDINRDKVISFITNQKTLLETMRQTRRELLKEEIADREKRVKLIEYELNLGKKYRVNSGGQTITENFSTEDFKSRRTEAAKLNAELKTTRKDLQALEGIDEIGARREGRGYIKPVPKKKTDDNADTPAKPLSKEELKKLASDSERLNEDLLKNQQQLTLNMLGEHQKELQAAQNKYDELTKKAKGNAAQLAKIESQAKQEIDQINDKYNKKYLSDFDKTIRGQLGHLNSRKKEEFDYADSRANDAAKRADKEWFEIVDHYDREIALAKSRNESIVQLEKDKQAEIDKLFAGRAAKQTNDYLADLQDSYQSELALAEESGISKEAIVRDHLERLKVLREQYGLLDVEQQKKVNKDIVKSERELLAIKLDNINKTGSAMTAGSQAISDLLSLTADNQSEYAEFQKAIGLFQIAVETGTAVASAVAQGTKGDPYTVILRIATAVAAVTAGMLKAKALMNEAKQPATPAFREHGGYTDLGSIAQDNSGNPEGWVARPTLFNLGKRSYIAGEGHKKEYVLSSAMLRNPAVADFAASMEALRQQRFFENGGSTAMSSSPAQVSFDPRMNDMLKYLQIIASKQTGLNYNMFEQYRDLVDNTRARASA